MGKKRKSRWKIIAFLAILGIAIYLCFHFEIIGIGGDGELGLGTQNALLENNPQIENVDLHFYLTEDKILFNKQEISFETFERKLKNTKRSSKKPELFYVDQSLTSGFFEKVKNFLTRENIVCRQVRNVDPKDVPK